MLESWEPFLHQFGRLGVRGHHEECAQILEMTLESDKPCNIFNQHGETRCTQHSSRKSRYACVVEAHESARTRIGVTQPLDHEDLIAEKGFNSLSHLKSFGQVQYSKQWKIRLRQPQWTKSGKARKIAGMASDEGLDRKTASKWHKKTVWPFILRRWCTFATSRTRSWSSSSRKTKVVCYSDVMWWKTILARIQHSRTSVRPHHKLRPRKIWM